MSTPEPLIFGKKPPATTRAEYGQRWLIPDPISGAYHWLIIVRIDGNTVDYVSSDARLWCNVDYRRRFLRELDHLMPTSDVLEAGDVNA